MVFGIRRGLRSIVAIVLPVHRHVADNGQEGPSVGSDGSTGHSPAGVFGRTGDDPTHSRDAPYLQRGSGGRRGGGGRQTHQVATQAVRVLRQLETSLREVVGQQPTARTRLRKLG